MKFDIYMKMKLINNVRVNTNQFSLKRILEYQHD